MDLIERVAQAIGCQDYERCPERRQNDNGRCAQCQSAARAAIAAMREPTEGMINTAHNANLDIHWWHYGDGSPGAPEDAWKAMIDAALEGK